MYAVPAAGSDGKVVVVAAGVKVSEKTHGATMGTVIHCTVKK